MRRFNEGAPETGFVIRRDFGDDVAADAMSAWLETRQAVETRLNPDPLSVDCPRCRAPRGRYCRSVTGATISTCKARIQKACR